MSRIYYFASDVQMDEQPNPYVKLLSVNEALAEGIEVELDFLEGVDYDEPEMILYCENEEKFAYPNIFAIDKDDYCEDIGTDKAYCTQLEWNYQDKTADVVLEYIKKQMEHTSEMEVWNVWLGDYNIKNVARRKICKLNDLTVDVLKNFFENERGSCYMRVFK